MFLKPVIFNEMPKVAQRGIIFWVLGWVCLLANFYWLTNGQGMDWIYKIVIAVGLLTYFLLTGQNWSRMISLMACAMAIFFSGILVIDKLNEFLPLAISATGLVLFGLAILFLLNKITAAFFKDRSRQETKEDTQQTR